MADDFDPIYSYDLNGNRTSMIDPTGLTTYTYDALNRLTSITNNKGITTTFTYDALGRRTSMTHGNGVVTTYREMGSCLSLLRVPNRTIATTINLNNNGLITHLPTTASAFSKVDLNAGTLTIDATSATVATVKMIRSQVLIFYNRVEGSANIDSPTP